MILFCCILLAFQFVVKCNKSAFCILSAIHWLNTSHCIASNRQLPLTLPAAERGRRQWAVDLILYKGFYFTGFFWIYFCVFSVFPAALPRSFCVWTWAILIIFYVNCKTVNCIKRVQQEKSIFHLINWKTCEKERQRERRREGGRERERAIVCVRLSGQTRMAIGNWASLKCLKSYITLRPDRPHSDKASGKRSAN